MPHAHTSTTELKAAVGEVWNNPVLSAYLHRAHASAVNAVYRPGWRAGLERTQA
ncbi:hypothetical protein JVU11DRAFT_2429 [Chiua virens]|nr:hypothetical protein JVU11DRAFT_2429 [Chiua virens]